MSTHDGRGPGYSRRYVIGALGACWGAAAVPRRALAAADSRTVSFVHTHTGERLRATYFQAGQYRPDCLAQVNHLLRDFRTGETHPIDPGLLDILYVLQTQAAHESAFEVISGFRSAATNAMLRRTSEGVAQHSMHLVGRAIDVRLQGYSTGRLHALARSLGRGGVGFYPASDFVHLDTGRVRFW